LGTSSTPAHAIIGPRTVSSNIISLKAMASPVLRPRHPLVRFVRCRTVAKVLSTDFALRRYRGRILGVKVILSSPGLRSRTRGTFTDTGTDTGPIPVIASRSGK